MTFYHDSPVEVWRLVSQHLCESGKEAHGVLVRFSCAAADESSMRAFDPVRIDPNLDRIQNVANTIFPSRTWENCDTRDELYARYKEVHRRGRRKSWGTYFLRFIQFGESEINQLERIITAHNNWPGSYKAAFVMHASSSETDALRRRGGPCLQYVQFGCPDAGTMNLTAVYRNHDYCNKALGNFFGLSRLLKFVCNETGRTPGFITCLSIHAYFDVSIDTQRQLAGI